MMPGLNEIGQHSCLTQCPTGFQPMQALNQDKARAVFSHQNGRFLAFGQNALRQRLDQLLGGYERGISGTTSLIPNQKVCNGS